MRSRTTAPPRGGAVCMSGQDWVEGLSPLPKARNRLRYSSTPMRFLKVATVVVFKGKCKTCGFIAAVARCAGNRRRWCRWAILKFLGAALAGLGIAARRWRMICTEGGPIYIDFASGPRVSSASGGAKRGVFFFVFLGPP